MAVLTVLGAPSFVYCAYSHFCMCGHMAHGPYSLGDIASDVLTLTCFGSNFVFSMRSSQRLRAISIIGNLSGLLVLSRALMFSLNGLAFPLEALFLLVSLLTAIAVLLGVGSFLTRPWVGKRRFRLSRRSPRIEEGDTLID